jgi:TRAP-type mannitol/chloroaromatic compound transport system permease large subunit
MKGIVPPDITMMDIYRSIMPFVFLQMVCLILLMIFPELATWLPNKMVTR